MTLIIIYFIVALIVLYTEAIDSFKTHTTFEIIPELIFSLCWVVSLPFSIYSVWKTQRKDTK